MEQLALRATELRYRTDVGDEVTTNLAEVDVAALVVGSPVRTFSWHPRQGNYPGWLWTATTGSLVGYESLLERDRVLLADFDSSVNGIVSQPFWVSGQDGDQARRHVPDYLLMRSDGVVLVVDVKPARMCEKPDVAAVLTWTGRLCRARGWRYEVFHGADPITMANLRFIAQGRRSVFLDARVVEQVAAGAQPGMTLGDVEAAVSGYDPMDVRASALSLLWRQVWVTDLTLAVVIAVGDHGNSRRRYRVSSGILTLHPGARLWFEGEAWELDAFHEEVVRIRRGVTIRSVSMSALLASATSLDDDRAGESGVEVELAAVTLAGLTQKQRREVDRKLDELRPLLAGEPDSSDRVARIAARARAIGISARTLERRLARYEALGPAGLVDTRLLRETRRGVDPRWDAACRTVLESYVTTSTPTRKTVIAAANRAFAAAVPGGRSPSPSVAYLRVNELAAGRYSFGNAKVRRSVAERPDGPMGRLRSTRPGEFFVLDTTPLDVFALEPVTGRWVNTELTVAMDVHDRTIKGLRLRPVAAMAADVASVLFQAMTPQRWGRLPDAPAGPYAGIPEALYVGETCIAPDTIVVDHGRIYMSEHTASVCRRLGISIQPALTYKPTDKPMLERFFRTARQGLLDKLAAYKGPDVASRGKNVEEQAFFYVTELEQILREWVGQVYHHTPHAGLPKPESPRELMTPAQAHARGMATCGRLRLPTRQDLFYEFLEVYWRKIHHYGVEVAGQRYDGAGLNLYRNHPSPYGGAHAGAWPILLDVDDVRYAYFRDPADNGWHQLVWEHAATLTAPFSQDAADFTRALSRAKDQFIDPAQAMADLLDRWAAKEVTTRRERNVAIRVATQPPTPTPGGGPAGPREPGVIDFFQARHRRQPELADDLDVFEAYYAANPEGGLEVFDE